MVDEMVDGEMMVDVMKNKINIIISSHLLPSTISSTIIYHLIYHHQSSSIINKPK